MTTEECWTHIERYLLERNWTGVLVMADALQELGEERLAGTLRWVSAHEIKMCWQGKDDGTTLYWSEIKGSWLDGDTITQWCEDVQRLRDYYL